MKTMLPLQPSGHTPSLGFFRRAALVLSAALALVISVLAQNPNLALGNPSNATADPTKEDNFLVEKEFFVLSYNNSTATPNWVSWRLVPSDIGRAKRAPNFHPDTTLPAGFTVIRTQDYDNSGFDRGHMCPHEDRSANDEMSAATFVLSNVIPQAKNVNEQRWERLEAYCRDLVQNHSKVLYIVAGPAGKGGQADNGDTKECIGRQRRIQVPSSCWKVIMVLDAGPGDDVAKVNANTRLIAVIMPNENSPGGDWAKFRHSVKDVEDLTHFTFFDKVDPAVINPLKEKKDDVAISQ